MKKKSNWKKKCKSSLFVTLNNFEHFVSSFNVKLEQDIILYLLREQGKRYYKIEKL